MNNRGERRVDIPIIETDPNGGGFRPRSGHSGPRLCGRCDHLIVDLRDAVFVASRRYDEEGR
jgi:hypothetical protein